jgi:hypothetical protein
VEIRRRGFLGLVLGGAAVLAAPAIIRPGFLMPIKPVWRETRYLQLSKVHLAVPGQELELPWFVKSLGTTWQRERDSSLLAWGEPVLPDRQLVLAKTLIEVPAGADLSSIGNEWNMERAWTSRLSRL